MDFQAVLLFPLHLGVLVLLHTVFACVRLTRVVSRFLKSRHQSTLDSDASPARDLAQKRWTKVPKHLAVVLAPVKWKIASRGDLARKERQLSNLVAWCKELGIPDLTVYDRDGLLVSNASNIARLDTAQPSLVKTNPAHPSIVTFVPAVSPTPPKPDQVSALLDQEQVESASSDGTGSSTLVSDGTATPKTSSTRFTLRLLSRDAGRPQIARVAQQLAAKRSQTSKASPLSSEQIAEVIDAFPLPEPDLLFVFGGSYLRLSGFPPWQIRLSEMYHYASPAWLPAPELEYSMFRKALDLYGRAEMRLGR